MSSIFETEEQRPRPTSTGLTFSFIIEGITWILTMFGCAIGLFILFTGMMTATGAPQEAVVVSLSIACCVIPYCIARSVHHLRNL